MTEILICENSAGTYNTYAGFYNSTYDTGKNAVCLEYGIEKINFNRKYIVFNLP